MNNNVICLSICLSYNSVCLSIAHKTLSLSVSWLQQSLYTLFVFIHLMVVAGVMCHDVKRLTHWSGTVYYDCVILTKLLVHSLSVFDFYPYISKSDFISLSVQIVVVWWITANEKHGKRVLSIPFKTRYCRWLKNTKHPYCCYSPTPLCDMAFLNTSKSPVLWNLRTGWVLNAWWDV